MKDAEAEVTDAYGIFVHTDGDHHDDDHQEEEFDDHVDVTLNQAQAGDGDSADVSRTVAV